MTATKIEWTDEVWNPVTGCDHVSPGCDNCYAERIATRFKRPFIGAVQCHEDRLEIPLRWRRSRRVFVNSVSDLFHPDVHDTFIHRVFAIMSQATDHTFQVLTKRPQRMSKLLNGGSFTSNMDDFRGAHAGDFTWPLPNVWLGVSVENQQYADMRIRQLLDTPAAVRFLSVEPMLGPIDLSLRLGVEWSEIAEAWLPAVGGIDGPRPNWIIVGGESGPGARPMHPQWVRDIRDQCIAGGVPFFFKQWGEWQPSFSSETNRENSTIVKLNGSTYPLAEPGPWSDSIDAVVNRVGKTRAGRELDGRTWDEYPA